MFGAIWLVCLLISNYFMGWYGCKFTFEYFWPQTYPEIDFYMDSNGLVQEFLGIRRDYYRTVVIPPKWQYFGRPFYIFIIDSRIHHVMIDHERAFIENRGDWYFSDWPGCAI